MKLLRAAEHRRMPWKNGGGETLEVAVSPPDAGAERFDWRVSMAVVGADGPFSIFPGIDRTLVLLEGEGMVLAIVGRDPVILMPDAAPCAFPGDVATAATLVGGAITDLNVMTARGRYTHDVIRFADARTVRAGARDIMLLCGAGATVESIILGPHDLALLEPGEAAHVRAARTCLLVTIRAIA